MMQTTTPNTPLQDLQQMPVEEIIIWIVYVAVIAVIITAIITHRVKFVKSHEEWLKTQDIMKKKSISSAMEYICMPFKQFHEYYSLNPERYQLEYAKVLVKGNYKDSDTGATRLTHGHECTIIFNLKDYHKYRAWIEKATNGMQDPRAVEDTMKFLELVQSDIQTIRDREAKAVNESQKTMQEVMGRIKNELSSDDDDDESPWAYE